MARRRRRTGGVFNYSAWLTKHFPLADRWDHQDLSGSSVLEAYNTALALGRELVVKDFTNAVWVPSGTVIVDDSDSFTSSATGSIQQPGGITEAREYTARFKGTTTASVIEIRSSDNATLYKSIIGSGAFDEAFVFTGVGATTGFRIKNNDAGTTDIDWANTTIKQTGIAASNTYPGPQLYVTPNAASDPNGNEADATTGWTAVNSATVTSDGTIKNVGDFSIKGVFTTTGGSGIYFDLNTILTVGIEYTLIFDTRHLGSNGDIAIHLSNTTNGTTTEIIGLDNTETTFQIVTHKFVHSANTQYFNCREKSGTNDGGAYIDNISITEQNPMDGTTVVAQVGVPTNFGSLGLSVVDDGAASYSGFHSAEVNSKFNPAAGFANIWAKVSGAGVWIDGVGRRLLVLAADATENQIILQRPTANNTLRVVYEAGNTQELIDISTTTIDWFMLTVTWEKPGNFIAYLNGVVAGTPQVIGGTWVGNLASTLTVIGAQNTTPANVWDGSRTRKMLGYALPVPTPAQVLSMYNQGRR